MGENCSVNRCLATLVRMTITAPRAIGSAKPSPNNCNLRAILRLQTRWSYILTMLKVYFELVPFVDSEDDEFAGGVKLPSSRAVRGITGHGFSCKALRGSAANPCDVRVWFGDAMKASYATSHPILLQPDFENGCVHVLKGALGEALEHFVVALAKGKVRLSRVEKLQPAYEPRANFPPTPSEIKRFFSVT
ncbi:hypothetical protein PHPALM_31236 [Phytophthora palmivora]|uniref:Uncharacterized protein n=1 Tax=Phytophthora palmivora TaxID=4796 RepID=A0A2P4X332_9STRA|nr:hypothetical protein PHPALM_31236 [Phytophthora palmivora]